MTAENIDLANFDLAQENRFCVLPVIDRIGRTTKSIKAISLDFRFLDISMLLEFIEKG